MIKIQAKIYEIHKSLFLEDISEKSNINANQCDIKKNLSYVIRIIKKNTMSLLSIYNNEPYVKSIMKNILMQIRSST